MGNTVRWVPCHRDRRVIDPRSGSHEAGGGRNGVPVLVRVDDGGTDRRRRGGHRRAYPLPARLGHDPLCRPALALWRSGNIIRRASPLRRSAPSTRPAGRSASARATTGTSWCCPRRSRRRNRHHRRQKPRGPARCAPNVRQFRRRQAQRAGACRGTTGGGGLCRTGPIGTVQSALPLWRGGTRQDAPDARDRLARAQPRTGAHVIYLSAEKFMYQFIRALRFRSTMDFKEEFRSVDLPHRRRAVHQRQGSDAGRIFSHLQRAGRPEPADRYLRRQITSISTSRNACFVAHWGWSWSTST